MKKLYYIVKTANMKFAFMLVLVVLGVVSSLLAVMPTRILGLIVDDIIRLKDMGAGTLNTSVWRGFAFFAGVILLGTVIRNVFCYYSSKFSNQLIYSIRGKMYAKLLRLDYGYILKNDRAKFVNTIYNASGRLETVFSTALFTVLSDVFDLIIMSIFIFSINPLILLILLLIIPGTYLLGISSGKYQKEKAKEKIVMEKEVITQINETQDLMDIIRVFHGEEPQEEKMEEVNRNYYKLCNTSDRQLSTFFVLEKTLRTAGILVSLLYVTFCILRGQIEVGNFLVITLYTEKFYAPITNLTKYFQMIQKGIASIDDIQHFLEMPETVEHENLEYDKNQDAYVVMDNVSVEVNGIPIISGVTCEFTKGMNLVEGRSGAGKSSLGKALLGMYKVSGEKIRIKDSLRKSTMLFSYASQADTIFNTSILENCIYPDTLKTVSDEKLERVKNMLQYFDIGTERFDSAVGENGCKISGGERKRVEFIRAVTADTPILLLDEITSNLDLANKEKMEKVIMQESNNRCVIFITHEAGERLRQAGCHAVRL